MNNDMNLINYYESIFALLSNKLNINPDQGDESFSDLYSLYPKINAITVDEIDEYINNAESENFKLLYREVRYIKECIIISEKYKKVFPVIKLPKNKKQEKEVEEIKNNQDIQSLINRGEELLESNIHLFYVGIQMSIMYGKLDKLDDSIRILNKLVAWYDTSKLMRKLIYQIMIDVYFRNKVKIQNKLFRDNHTWLTITLYKFGKFSYYHPILFRSLIFFGYTILLFVIGKQILFVLGFMLLFNGVCLLASHLRKLNLLFAVYFAKIFFILYSLFFSTIIYLFVQAIYKL